MCNSHLIVRGSNLQYNPDMRTEYLMIRSTEGFHADRVYRFIKSNYEPDTVLIQKRTVPLGSFKLLPYSTGDVYFYDFSLFRESRGHGEGTALFPQILCYLHIQGYKRIKLQVSSTNPAALSLYRHFDFEIEESVSI